MKLTKILKEIKPMMDNGINYIISRTKHYVNYDSEIIKEPGEERVLFKVKGSNWKGGVLVYDLTINKYTVMEGLHKGNRNMNVEEAIKYINSI